MCRVSKSTAYKKKFTNEKDTDSAMAETQDSESSTLRLESKGLQLEEKRSGQLIVEGDQEIILVQMKKEN